CKLSLRRKRTGLSSAACGFRLLFPSLSRPLPFTRHVPPSRGSVAAHLYKSPSSPVRIMVWGEDNDPPISRRRGGAMNDSYLLIATVSACAWLAGAIFALPGAVTVSLGQHLHLPEGRGRVLHTLFLLLLVPMMLVSGLLIDKWGVQTLLLIGTLLA